MQTKELLFFDLKDRVPNDSVLSLKQSLENAGEDKLERLILLNLKNPILALVLSLFLGFLGIDRIYKGDFKLGALKFFLFATILILFVFLTLLSYSLLGDYMDYTKEEATISLFASPLLLAVFMLGLFFLLLIWSVIDIFLVFFGIKKDNLKKILEILS